MLKHLLIIPSGNHLAQLAILKIIPRPIIAIILKIILKICD